MPVGTCRLPVHAVLPLYLERKYIIKMADDAVVDPELVRLNLFHQLIDWDGSDLKNVYEPITWHFGYLFTLFMVVLGLTWMWGFVKKYRTSLPSYVKYCRVMNTELLIDQAISDSSRDFRTCAVIGGTGFIGSHLVNELLKSKFYRVYVLSRNIPTESKRHPDVAGYVQVDMRDYDSLVRAFANVDTVFHLGAVIPNAFVSSEDAVWKGNRGGGIAVVGACKTAGVKNLIYLNGFEADRQQRGFVFSSSKMETSKVVLAAHGEDGLNVCVANASFIFGPGDRLSWDFVTGRVTTFPNIKQEFYFMHVSNLTQLLVQLEEKLASGDDRIAGKAVDLPGEKMTYAEFLSLPEWKRQPKFVSVGLAKALARLNTLCALLIRYAPLGDSVCPQIINDLHASMRCDVLPDDMLTIFGLEQVPSVRNSIAATVAELTA